MLIAIIGGTVGGGGAWGEVLMHEMGVILDHLVFNVAIIWTEKQKKHTKLDFMCLNRFKKKSTKIKIGPTSGCGISRSHFVLRF